jgi:lysophospholipase L1-like esterase
VQYYRNHKVLSLFLICIVIIVGALVAEVLYIMNNGKPVVVPDIPRNEQLVGKGTPLKYVIIGDSTGVGQGGNYEKGIAAETAAFIASQGYQVHYQNLSTSGARIADVLYKQSKQAIALHPDIVLVAAGANDVTHLTRLANVKRDTEQIINNLQAANPAVKIVMTGSPEMGSVPRFPQPVKYLAGVRTANINKVFDDIAKAKGVTRVPIAEVTGPTFMKHPELFAADKFHPLDKGYAVWFAPLNKALYALVSVN